MSKNIGPLARRYGLALFEAFLAEPKLKNDKAILEKSVLLAQALSVFFQKKNIAILLNPVSSYETKFKILENVFFEIFNNDSPISKVFYNFLKVVLEKNRFIVVRPALDFYVQKMDEFMGVQRSTLISAKQPSEEEILEFSSALAAALKKEIKLEVKTDPSLRSGFMVAIGNTRVDTSLRSRLQNLRAYLS